MTQMDKDVGYQNFLGIPAEEAYCTWRYLWYQSELAPDSGAFLTMKQIKSRVVPPRLAVGPEWDKARDKEMDSWAEWKAYTWRLKADFPGEPVCDPLLVYTRKEDGTAKARCTLRGALPPPS